MKKLLIHAAIGCCALVGGERIQPVGAQVLLPYGTNVARVIGLELNYFPDRSQLQVAATTDTRFVKRADYRNDAAIQNVLQLITFQGARQAFCRVRRQSDP